MRVWYSSNAIYFGIRAFEPHGSITATLADRDRVSTDDYVEIHLDTFDERNRALVFIVNPLGVQADGTTSENGGFIPGSNVIRLRKLRTKSSEPTNSTSETEI